MNRQRIQQLIDWLVTHTRDYAPPISNVEPDFDMSDWAQSFYVDDVFCGTACCLAGKAVVDSLVEDCNMQIDDAVQNVEHGFHPSKTVEELAAEWLDLPLIGTSRQLACRIPLFYVASWPSDYQTEYTYSDGAQRQAAIRLLTDMLNGTVQVGTDGLWANREWWAQYGVTP